MTDLKERIISILHNYKEGNVRDYPVGKAASDITEAFVDCRWHEAPEGTAHSYVQTGAQWFDRFQAELYKKKFQFIEKADDYTTILMIVEDAARRAAGIDIVNQDISIMCFRGVHEDCIAESYECVCPCHKHTDGTDLVKKSPEASNE